MSPIRHHPDSTTSRFCSIFSFLKICKGNCKRHAISPYAMRPPQSAEGKVPMTTTERTCRRAIPEHSWAICPAPSCGSVRRGLPSPAHDRRPEELTKRQGFPFPLPGSPSRPVQRPGSPPAAFSTAAGLLVPLAVPSVRGRAPLPGRQGRGLCTAGEEGPSHQPWEPCAEAKARRQG